MVIRNLCARRTFWRGFCLAILQCAAWGQVQFLRNNSVLESLPSVTTSTIPASNGDLNPYGVAFVPAGFPTGGRIAPGDVLVSNFNSSSNLGGTGTTIVGISPSGRQSLFATSSPIGLSTALGVLSRGFVVVGNLPVTYPAGTVGQGSLQVFDRNGNLVTTFTDPTFLDSPWDLTIDDDGSTAQLFVSNAVSATVVRLDLSVNSGNVTIVNKTVVGSGFSTAFMAGVIVVGPTGLAYNSARDVLYVASTLDNAIFGIGNAAHRTTSAGTGFMVYTDPTNLHGPLGLTLAPNGNLITANGDAVNAVAGMQNELVEFTQQGTLVAVFQLDSGAPGAAFGLASTFSMGTVRFAAVDDDQNTLTVWTLRPPF
ncbi:MAG TPA: hypothetical protein VGR73_11935 [Bryobacteraceae bacterium]|nr:hypothetical protein [Bryobacteraceae bacterium]